MKNSIIRACKDFSDNQTLIWCKSW